MDTPKITVLHWSPYKSASKHKWVHPPVSPPPRKKNQKKLLLLPTSKSASRYVSGHTQNNRVTLVSLQSASKHKWVHPPVSPPPPPKKTKTKKKLLLLSTSKSASRYVSGHTQNNGVTLVSLQNASNHKWVEPLPSPPEKRHTKKQQKLLLCLLLKVQAGM